MENKVRSKKANAASKIVKNLNFDGLALLI